MSRLPPPVPEPRSAPTSALGPADPQHLAFAAELLRERTMSLDPEDREPTKRLVLMAIGVTVVAAATIVLFRHQLRWVLSLLA